MNRKCSVNYLMLLAVGILIFSLSEYIQWYGDSYYYRFSFFNGKPIESLSDIITSQYAHYQYMNGRFWAHVLCQGFSALWGQTAFAICNAAIYIVFVLLFVRISGASWERTSSLLTCILTILFFCDTSYNANCQIGYIWTSTVTLAFIIQYFRARKHSHYGWWELVLLFVLALFAGSGNEAIAIGTGGALIYDFFRHFKRLTSAQWVMMIGFSIGGLFLCLSPGILHRAKMAEDGPDFVWSAYRLLIYSRMLYVMIITVAILKLQHKVELKEFISDNSFFFVALGALLVFNFIIGVGLTNRQLFGVELFAGIITVRALKNAGLAKWILILSAAVVTVIYVIKFDYITKSNEDLRTLRNELSQMEDFDIFMDFHRYPKFVHPTELDNTPKMYRFVSFGIIYDMANFCYSYQRNRIEDPPYFTKLRIYPKIMKGLIKSGNLNFALKCSDGSYLVVRDKNNPKSFFLKRNFNVLGLKWPKEPYKIEFDGTALLNTDSLYIVYKDFHAPLVENGEIIME